ncbi:uncharacterized protein LOC113366978 [Ctenocephalides felis]|uniref:uncharacterized protein LOC113366978 n=1 Tax=Ctenocephalides felis TaxID=7515 RepID=UPI000E6E236D|nr:uncharacterized protein LOC113366978 [Ctenocephalides felis]
MIDHDLMDMFIDSFHAFSLVEERAFKKLMRWIPGYVLPSRKTVSGSMLEEQTQQDVWTTRVTEAYVAVTDHYITDNYTRLETRNLKTVLLGCCQLEGAHTSENLAIEIQTILDNRKFLQKSEIDIIKKIVSHFRRSVTACEKMQQYGHTKIDLRCRNKWNSTFYMVERFVEVEESIRMTMSVLDANVPSLTSEMWKMLTPHCLILKPFEDITTTESGENYLTGSLELMTDFQMSRGARHLESVHY